MHYIVVVERQGFLLSAGGPPDDLDVPKRRKRSRTAGHADRLHHIDPRVDHECTGRLHLPDHVDAVASDLLQRYGHDRLGDEAPQVLRDLLLQLTDSLVARIDLSAERKRESAVRLD